MKNGKHAASGGMKRSLVLVVSLLVMMLVVAGGTLAWLSTKVTPITNTFYPSTVSCDVTENFDSSTGVKTNVNVENTGNIDAFIRVKLVTYRTNDAGQHIGGTATIPDFELGEGWVEHDGYYYYTKPVAPNQKPASNLANSMPLSDSYSDTDGGKQAIDVMAEAIQSLPARAVQDAWGVTVSDNGTLAVN